MAKKNQNHVPGDHGQRLLALAVTALALQPSTHHLPYLDTGVEVALPALASLLLTRLFVAGARDVLGRIQGAELVVRLPGRSGRRR